MLLTNDFLGKEIKNIYGEVFFENITSIENRFVDSDIISFYMSFNGLNVTIEVDGSGDGIKINKNKPLRNVDMSEYGYIKIIELLEYLNLTDYKGLILSSIGYVMHESKQVGIVFVFNELKKIIVVNYGDQLYCTQELNKHMLEEGFEIVLE